MAAVSLLCLVLDLAVLFLGSDLLLDRLSLVRRAKNQCLLG